MANTDEKKKAMRTISAQRREDFKDAGLVQRSVWIRAEDIEAFKEATAALTDHARIIAYLIGYDLGMTPAEIFRSIKTHGLPYDPDDMRVLLSRGWADDGDDTKAEGVLRKYKLPISIDRLRE